MASDAWQQRVDDLWASFDDEDAFVAKVEALASELPDDSPEAAFERACAFDSTGHSAGPTARAGACRGPRALCLSSSVPWLRSAGAASG